jgi:hypothetical protein
MAGITKSMKRADATVRRADSGSDALVRAYLAALDAFYLEHARPPRMDSLLIQGAFSSDTCTVEIAEGK